MTDDAADNCKKRFDYRRFREAKMARKEAAKEQRRAARTPHPGSNDPDDVLFKNLADHTDKLVLQVRYRSAMLNAMFFAEDVPRAIQMIASMRDATDENDRQQARDFIRTSIEKNAHLSESNMKAIMVTALWLVSPIISGHLKAGLGVVIEITDLGSRHYNFRTMVLDYIKGDDENEANADQPDAANSDHTRSPHDRRGHWRHYQNGRRVWVRSCSIHGGAKAVNADNEGGHDGQQ